MHWLVQANEALVPFPRQMRIIRCASRIRWMEEETLRRIVGILIVILMAIWPAVRSPAAPLSDSERIKQMQKIEALLAQSKDAANRVDLVREQLRQLRRLRASIPDAEDMLLQLLSGPDADALAADVGDVLRLLGPLEKQKVQVLADNGTIPKARADTVLREFTLLENAQRDLANSMDSKARISAADLIQSGNAATQADMDVALSDAEPGVLISAAKMARDLALADDEWSRLGEFAKDKNPDLRREATATAACRDGQHPLPDLDAATVASLRTDPVFGQAASAWLQAHPQTAAATQTAPSTATSGVAGSQTGAATASGPSPVSPAATQMNPSTFLVAIASLDVVLATGGILGLFRLKRKFRELERPVRWSAIGGLLTSAGWLAYAGMLFVILQRDNGLSFQTVQGEIHFAFIGIPLCGALLIFGWALAVTSGRALDWSLLVIFSVGTLLLAGGALIEDVDTLAQINSFHVPDMATGKSSAPVFSPEIIVSLCLEAVLIGTSVWTLIGLVLARSHAGGRQRASTGVTLMKVPPLPFNLE